jgi:hypothetical protein
MKHILIAWVHTIVAFVIFFIALDKNDYWCWVAVWFAFTTACFGWIIASYISDNIRKDHERT